MPDARVDRLARLIVRYSLELGEGTVTRFDGGEPALPFLVALYREALLAGANPSVAVAVDGLPELLLELGSDEQLTHVPPAALEELERLQASVTVWSDTNTKALASTDPARQALLVGARRDLGQRRMQRVFGGSLAWCGTLFPSRAHAQDAEMALDEYEDFVYAACHVADPEADPVAHWQGVSAQMHAHAATLADVRELRILGPDTDLHVGVAGRSWVVADGKRNMPDGEVFTSPLETQTNGEIRYAFPAVYQGRQVEDVRLRFADGKVVAAEAASGQAYLDSIIGIDGADVLGEVAFGLNYEIDRFTGNILFDEKIGGTMHLALGAAFPPAGGQNVSAVHWDMICDLRAEGEVYADGELVWKAGRFLA